MHADVYTIIPYFSGAITPRTQTSAMRIVAPKMLPALLQPQLRCTRSFVLVQLSRDKLDQKPSCRFAPLAGS